MKQRAVFPNRPTGSLVMQAKLALGMSHREFGEALGASERTSARVAANRSPVSVPQLCALAKLVYPRNPALAAALAEASSETLESLGLVAPAPAPAPAPAAPLPPRFVADLLVCAAADATGASSGTARAALVAAFGRAREMGLSVGEVVEALGAKGGKAKGA